MGGAAQGIRVENAWARATAPSQSVGGVFLTITDTGAPDALVSVASPIATTLELHETVADNGVMRMRPIAALPLPSGQPVTLKPGSYHLMAMGLKQPLKQGDSFPVTLNFLHAAPMTVTAVVASAGASGPEGGMAPMDHAHMDHGMMDHGAMDHSAMDHSGMDHSGMAMPKP